jgi:exonuclease III
MSTTRRARLRARHFVLSLSAALLVLAGGASAAGAAQVESPSNQLQVWNLNTHGMDTGLGSPPNNSPDDRTDYRDFVSYIVNPNRASFFPDVITLQETGTNAGGKHTTTCNEFAWLVHAGTNRAYQCQETTQVGGTAIVYRADRLTLLAVNKDVHLKTVATHDDLQNGIHAGDCLPGNWYALVMLFQDQRDTSKYLAVASVHLPTTDYTNASGTTLDCSWENTQTVNSAVNNPAVKMQIMAGDWNHRDATVSGSTNQNFLGWRCTYAGTNALVGTCGGQNLGWRDGIYDICRGATDAATYSCLHTAHGTFADNGIDNNKRIDFMFAKASAIFNPRTVFWSDADADGGGAAPHHYSDHRGQGALVQYNP